jgi:hypothetical protein
VDLSRLSAGVFSSIRHEAPAQGNHRGMDRPTKITFADMRGMGVRGLFTMRKV